MGHESNSQQLDFVVQAQICNWLRDQIEITLVLLLR